MISARRIPTRSRLRLSLVPTLRVGTAPGTLCVSLAGCGAPLLAVPAGARDRGYRPTTFSRPAPTLPAGLPVSELAFAAPLIPLDLASERVGVALDDEKVRT